MKDLYDSTILEQLYITLKNEIDKKYPIKAPVIKNSNIFEETSHAHEAGYDAFICGSGI